MNNYFKFISALFIIFCLSCSQNSSKKQLVGEGYKGVPWNTSGRVKFQGVKVTGA